MAWRAGRPDLEKIVLCVLDRIAEPVQSPLEIIGEQRHAEKVLLGTVDMLAARGVERLVELLGAKLPPADPGERHEARLLVFVHVADEGPEFAARRVVVEGFKN